MLSGGVSPTELLDFEEQFFVFKPDSSENPFFVTLSEVEVQKKIEANSRAFMSEEPQSSVFKKEII